MERIEIKGDTGSWVTPKDGDDWSVHAFRMPDGTTSVMVRVSERYLANMPSMDDMEICYDCGQVMPDHSEINDVIRGLAAMLRG